MTVRTWSAEDVRALPAVVDLPTAGQILGLGRTLSHELARRGQFPVPVLRLGHRYRVPTAPILQLLFLGPDSGEAGATTPASTPTGPGGRNAIIPAPPAG